MTTNDMGVLRRAPRLWEQQLTDQVIDLNPGGVGVASGTVIASVLEGSETPEPNPAIPTDLAVPSAPTWTSTVAMLAVSWNGLDTDGDAWLVNTASWVECHVSPTPNFTPSKETNRGQYQTGGGTIAVTSLKSDTDYWIKLVGRDDADGDTVSVEVKAHTGLIMDTDIGKGAITADKVSFNAREIGGITTGIGDRLPPEAENGDIFLLKVRNPDGGVVALQQYQFDGTKWNPVEWGAAALSAKCITAIQIAAGAVTADAILAGEITAEKIKAGTITADSACIGSLNAGKISTGTMLADRIKGGTIQGSNLRTPVGPDKTQVVIGQDGSGDLSDWVKFIKNGDIKGQIRGQDDGLWIYGGGASQPVTLAGQAGVTFAADAIDPVTFNAAQGHRVIGIDLDSAQPRKIVYFTGVPKMTGEDAGADDTNMRALVDDLRKQVDELSGRIAELEAAR